MELESKESKESKETKKEKEVVDDIDKKHIYLQWATLNQIMKELKKRKYKFIFVGETTWGKKELKMSFGTDDLVQPVRLAVEVFDTVLDFCEKTNTHDAFSKTLQSVMLQMEILFGTNPNGEREDDRE